MTIGFGEFTAGIDNFVNHSTVYWAFNNPLTSSLLIVGVMMVALFLYVDELKERQYMHLIFWVYVGSVAIFYLQNKVLLAPNSKKESRTSALLGLSDPIRPPILGQGEISTPFPSEKSNWIGTTAPALPTLGPSPEYSIS